MTEEGRLLDEQLAYYRARAGEYDEWFLREGRYDRGPEQRAEWFKEVGAVEAGLRAAGPRGRALMATAAPAVLDQPALKHGGGERPLERGLLREFPA